MRLHIFEHQATCGAAALLEWMLARGIEPQWTRFHAGDALPALEEIDALVVLGGTMNIYQDQKYPYLKPLRSFMRDALTANKSILGLCLGAQLIADALGSPVYRAPVGEMGWTEMHRRDEAKSSPLLDWLPDRGWFVSWHGDTFDVPAGAVHGAQSAVCAAQAFAWGGKVLALQFHLETHAAEISRWIEAEPEERRASLWPLFLPFEEEYRRQKQLLFQALDIWIHTCRS
jgi:GMP synthase (glutamine-hydrolysing)